MPQLKLENRIALVTVVAFRAKPIAEVAEGYKAMDERRAIKTLLRVDE